MCAPSSLRGATATAVHVGLRALSFCQQRNILRAKKKSVKIGYRKTRFQELERFMVWLVTRCRLHIAQSGAGIGNVSRNESTLGQHS